MAHQMGPQDETGHDDVAPTATATIDRVSTELATLKEIVAQQQQMISKWLKESVSKPGNGSGHREESADQVRNRCGETDSIGEANNENVKDETNNSAIVEQQPRDIRKLLGDLKIDRGAFDPKSEAELDDITEEWEIQAEGFGHQVDLLRFVVNRVGSQTVREVARQGLLDGLPWTTFVDCLAKGLFRFSRQLESVERQLDSDDRNVDVEEAIRKFRRLIWRHQKLCRRWNSPNGFHEVKLKECLMRKLPHEYLEKLMMEDWRPMSLQDFICLCQRTHDALLRCAEFRRTERGLFATLCKPEGEPFVAPALISHGANRSEKCHNCGQLGHYQRNCPLPKSKCGTCGRVGHHTEQCRRIVTERPLGQQTALIRNTRNGIFIEMKDNQNKQQILSQLATFFNGQAEKQKEIRNKARERRQRKDPRETSDPDEGSDQELEDSLARMQPNGGRMVHPVRLTRGPKWWIRANIAGIPVGVILDTGAEVSVLTSKMWFSLPTAVRANASCHNRDDDKNLSGLGGSLKAMAIVDLPIEVGGITLLQQFWIVPDFPYNLLGAPWMKDAGAVIDCQEQMTWLKVGDEETWVALHEGIYPPPNIVATVSHETPAQLDPCDISAELPMEHRKNIQRILEVNSAAWAQPELGKCTAVQHEINTGSALPIAMKPRKLSPEKQEEVKHQVAELLEAGAIEKSKGPWAAPLVLVPKKGGGWRMCVDYRELNRLTKKDAYPLPRIDALIRMFEGSSYFSTLDLKSGYHQVRMAEKDREKTAFITPFGLYQSVVMPFGLCNAPATFQRLVDSLFEEYIGHGVGVYIDDIVIYADSAETHDDLLDTVLRILTRNGLFLNIKKSMFGYRRVKYLGMIVDGGGIYPDPTKVALVSRLQPPKEITALRRFLGTIGYFRQFINGFASRAEALTRLLRRGTPWNWAQEQQAAFEDLRGVLEKEPIVLSFPHPSWPWVLDTDASGTQVAAVLQQTDPLNRPRVIAYASRCLTMQEQVWPIRELEAFAIVWAILHFAEYLRGQQCFTVRTDHESLKWLWGTDNKRVARWALALQEFQFKVLYQKGSRHHHVDIFTRDIPITPMDESLTSRIALTADVFTLAPVCQLQRDPCDVTFPTVDEFKEEQQKEADRDHSLECVNDLLVNRYGRVYVPLSLRRQLMYFYHFSRAGGHQGITRTYNRMAQHFWWPSMKNDIQQYNGQCLTCTRRRPHVRQKLGGNLLADRPGLIVGIDVVGPVEHHQHRYYLFTIIDHFTKFAEVVVLTETSSRTVWQVFFVRWLAVWGCPTYLLSDNGPQFTSKEFQGHCQEFGIQKIYALPYHPQGNGVVESFHQFLTRSVAAYVSQTSWSLVDIVASVMLAYRSTPHPSTGESPYRLMTGLDLVLPHFQDWAEYSVDHMDTYRRFNLLAQVRRDCLDRTLRIASKSVTASSSKSKSPLNVGDLVVCWLTPTEVAKLLTRFGSLKFAPRWSEPCRIVKFFNEERSTMLVKSIWHRGVVKKVHEVDVLKLPTRMTTETLNAAKFDLIADLKRNAALNNTKKLNGSEFLKRIPAEDREVAVDHLTALEQAWPVVNDDLLTQGTVKRITNDVPSTFHEIRAENSQKRKRCSVELHAVWRTINGDDVAL